ncbi:alkane 1-monooxygenase [Brevundimonas sp.]|uniref:alkane 1-monooxygenase n=1 Tax=Brevundimonas sp. TaxID=1871086 RepID=UPI002488CB75|nr:alkane 1-monooxygenase [Brevundimonas sp.]MDI1281797.1 alkane 1-monooxygenase [Brevundimonas sp.]
MSTIARILPADDAADRYVDRKRYLWMLSVVWPAAPLIGLYLVSLTGWGIFYAFTLVVWYGVIPALDVMFGNDPNNPPEAAVARLEADRYYRILTYLTVPVHYASLIVSAWWVATQPMAWWEVVMLALSLGIVNGLALNTGHELGHKKAAFERWMAKIVLAVVGYGHFFIEHNKGHHRDVATPEDPATSRMGEGIYKFSLREIPGAFKRAWNLEKVRLERAGKGVWSLDNEIIQPLLITVVLYASLLLALGPDPKLLVFLPIQIAFGWWQLTSANYIEHYGLLREKMADGRYERAQPRHSWNSNHIASNLILFHLQRHSDHHAHPTRRYQSLRDFPNLPVLPAGYPGMFFMAMIPPVFRSVMDRRVVEWAGGDLAKIQIDPARRKQIIRKFGASRQSARIAAE